ncbi:MAG: hypothetical protein RIT81_27715 [Deltaproteobacteria bacterium]
MVAPNPAIDAVEPQPWGRNFLARPIPLALIFGTFFFVTIPLIVLESAGAFEGWRLSPTFLFVAVFGMSHFLITFPIYLNKTNIEHFVSRPRYFVLHFVVPVALIGVIALGYYLQTWNRGYSAVAIFGFWLFLGLRGLDFYHVVRQSFGVLELTKGQAKLKIPPHTKVMAKALFMTFFCLQMHTFMSGKTFTAEPLSVGLCVVAGALFLGLLAYYVRNLLAVGAEDRSYALIPIAYLVCQGSCAALAVWRTEFYLAALGMHYMEYHILMQPRVFANLREDESVGDRLMGMFKRNQWVFYVGLIALSVFIYCGPRVANGFEHPLGGSGWIYWVFVIQSIIGSLHFYVDSLLWRFSNPFYRKTLGPLYFTG